MPEEHAGNLIGQVCAGSPYSFTRGEVGHVLNGIITKGKAAAFFARDGLALLNGIPDRGRGGQSILGWRGVRVEFED